MIAWSWVLSAAAVLMAVISAAGMITTQAAATESTVTDAAQAGQLALFFAVGASFLGLGLVVTGMIVTSVAAGRAQSRGRKGLVKRSLIIMGLGLSASFCAWVLTLLVWGFLR